MTEGKFAMPKISLKQIAEEAGVSPSLVSQVLNNRGVRVSKDTRQRILDVTSKHHYKPNKLASGLKLKRTDTIAVIVPFTPVGFFSELVYHIEAYAMNFGYISLVLNTFGDRDKEMQILSLYQSQMADGILFAPQDASFSNADFSQMQAEGYPLVFIDRHINDMKAITVSSNHFEVARELTMHLIDRGSENILFIKRDNELLNSTKISRIEGYVHAMNERSMPPQIIGFEYSDIEDLDLYAKLEGRRQPDAIFLYSGFYMPYLLKICRLLGYDIERIQFATVDPFIIPFSILRNREIQYNFNNNLIVAVQDTAIIAQQAVSSLIHLIKGERSLNVSVYVPVKFVQL